MDEHACIDLYEDSKQLSTKIRIFGGPTSRSGEHQSHLDTTDGNEVDVFTLEDFKTAIIESRKVRKDYLMARITTQDPNDSNHFFNYYYSAIEVNKVLFKFESDRRLLHRMKAKNPLNNQNIIGSVFYYTITCATIDECLVNYYYSTALSEKHSPIRAFSDVSKRESAGSGICSESKDTLDIKRNRNYTKGKAPGDIIKDLQNGLGMLPAKWERTRDLFYNAYFFATDDDFLNSCDVREYFRRNSLDPDDEFLFELDRTNQDFFALMDENSENMDENVMSWKRMISAHMSVFLAMLGIIVLLGANPIILIIAFPIALATLVSLVLSLLYLSVFRRDSFNTQAVNTVDDM